MLAPRTPPPPGRRRRALPPRLLAPRALGPLARRILALPVLPRLVLPRLALLRLVIRSWVQCCWVLPPVVLALALGCGRDAPEQVVVRLAEVLPGATFAADSQVVDLGDPAAGELLGAGWDAAPAGAGKGAGWRWSRGGASTLRLWVSVPRPLRLELRGRAHPRAAEGLQVEVWVGERRVGEVRLEQAMRRHTLDLPARVWRPGENVLTLRYPPASGRGRRLAAWQEVRLAAVAEAPAAAPAAAPARGPGGAGLTLAAGGSMAFALDLPARSRLVIDGLTAEGGSGGLRVTVEDEAGGRTEVVRQPGGSCCAPLPLAGGEGELVRVTLRGEGGAGALRLLEPRVVAPGAPAPAARAAGGKAAPEAAAAAAAPAGLVPSAARSGEPAARPNVLVYLIDTLRADRLGVYGHGGGLTPHLDAFAREATVFENAIAQAPWTRSSIASLFTGLEALDHGVWSLQSQLTDGAVTLAELLRDSGYRTAAFSTNYNVAPATGLHQGFAEFDLVTGSLHSRAVNRRVFRWLDSVAAGEPWFLYVHTLDPHQPYNPEPEMRGRFAAAVPAAFVGTGDEVERARKAAGEERAALTRDIFRLYDAEVAENDRSFGDLVAELRRRGWWDDAWVIVLSDHGEEFDEHGAIGHGQNLHAETLDIPLLVKAPRQREGRRVGRPVQHTDLLPTLARAVGFAAPAGLRGEDLFAAERPGAPPRSIFSHLANRHFGMSVRRGEWKLVRPLATPDAPASLYRRRAAGDGAEREDLAPRHPLRAEYLRSLLLLEIARPHLRFGVETELDARTRAGLRALGYL